MSELRSVTCHTGSHSVTCHPTQVNASRLNPSQTGRYSIYLPRRDGRMSWHWWLVAYRGSLPVRRHQSPIHSDPTRSRTPDFLLVSPTSYSQLPRQVIQAKPPLRTSMATYFGEMFPLLGYELFENSAVNQLKMLVSVGFRDQNQRRPPVCRSNGTHDVNTMDKPNWTIRIIDCSYHGLFVPSSDGTHKLSPQYEKSIIHTMGTCLLLSAAIEPRHSPVA